MDRSYNIDIFLELIPQNKVITLTTLSKIFCLSPNSIKKYSQNHHLAYKIVGSYGLISNISDKDKQKLIQDGISIQNNKIHKDSFWSPSITNYYISLITQDSVAKEIFIQLSQKIITQNPLTIVKIPSHYHITLADLVNTPITKNLLKDIESTTHGLHSFSFSCSIHKPYIDSLKKKVIFWICIPHDPFLLTLQNYIKQFVPRRSEKTFTPHITLGKLLQTTSYNEKFLEQKLDITCIFDKLCITANIDTHKDIILFSKKLS